MEPRRVTLDALRERSHELTRKRPGYAPLLDFYLAVREVQQASRAEIGTLSQESSKPESPFPFDAGAASRLFLVLCELGRTANRHFASEVEKIESCIATGSLDLTGVLAAAEHSAETGRAASEMGLDERVLSFLVSQSLRPSIEVVRDRMMARLNPEAWREPLCPICNSPPTLSLLKGEPALRYALCSHCGCQWRVDRMSCLACGNTNHKTLSHFHGEGEGGTRIDLCDNCHSYIKTIDVRGFETADACLEDLATQHLDLIATQKDFSRVVSNVWCD